VSGKFTILGSNQAVVGSWMSNRIIIVVVLRSGGLMFDLTFILTVLQVRGVCYAFVFFDFLSNSVPFL